MATKIDFSMYMFFLPFPSRGFQIKNRPTQSNYSSEQVWKAQGMASLKLIMPLKLRILSTIRTFCLTFKNNRLEEAKTEGYRIKICSHMLAQNRGF